MNECNWKINISQIHIVLNSHYAEFFDNSWPNAVKIKIIAKRKRTRTQYIWNNMKAAKQNGRKNRNETSEWVSKKWIKKKAAYTELPVTNHPGGLVKPNSNRHTHTHTRNSYTIQSQCYINILCPWPISFFSCFLFISLNCICFSVFLFFCCCCCFYSVCCCFIFIQLSSVLILLFK